ncbi:hypothetical protein EDB80DRAFT_699548 [Ilyonectria destructans]|nr:hypothetical protein EDB80DRAFT_699548 [Ilyonectria destructans]
MQSHSRSHLRPAFNHLTAADGELSASLGSDDLPSAEQFRLWSFQQPSLTVGSYALSVRQEVTLPSGETVPLDTPDKVLRVSQPRFQLADPADLYSVHPAPGHSAYARTLANVVFSHATTPWERDISSGKDFGFNKLPSMAVLTFSEEELVLDPEAWKGLGFKAEDEKPTGCGSIVTKASRLVEPACAIKSILNAPGSNTDFKPQDKLSLLVLGSELFKDIFTAYGDGDQPAWTGHADLSKFAMMASAQESVSGFTAGSFADNNGDAHQPRFSVIVSPRTAPPVKASPTRVISHLISLEDVEKVTLSAENSTGQYVGLVSLHAWEWMSVPEDATDFAHVMAELGKNISPLRVPYSDKAKRDGNQSPPPEAVAWSKAMSNAGYVLKPHTDVSGAQSMVLIRGPLIPVKPSKKPAEAFSLYGEGLALVDKKSDLPDVSYQSAWTLGRSLIMADRALSASLLRLRGNIHAEAVRRAKAKALDQRGYGVISNKETYLAGLEDAVKYLQQAQDIGGLGKRNPAHRWTRAGADTANLPVMRLSKDTSYSIDDYRKQVEQVTMHMFGYESSDSDGKSIPIRQIDADAAAIRAWAINCCLLASVPLHSLVLDPAMLPSESIRTFCIDNNWIDFLVDGGLSLANHFARDDDAIRSAVKKCINTYLDTPLNGGTIPQLPRWGFFLRSVAVSSFPDLRVEAPLPIGAPRDAREVLFMQVLADDVLICLFDRLPGERELSYIRIYQPHHQQGFSLGTSLSDKELAVFHRGVPKQLGQDVGTAPPQTFEAAGPVLAFDFKARTLRPDAYMDQYYQMIKNMPDVFQVTDGSKPSSLLATQLRAANLRLQLNAEVGNECDNGASRSDRWTNAGFQLSVGSGPRPDETAGEEPPCPDPVSRAPPSNAVLPTGPRRQLHTSVSPYAHVDVESRSSRHKLPEELQQSESSNMLPYYAIPQHVNCCLCYEPGNTSNLIYATETPTDLIFNLSAEEPSGIPAEVELRIPVALSSGIYPPPVKDGSKGVLVIPGTAGQPILPVLEDLNPSRWWSYDCKLATSSLYSLIPEKLPEEGDSVPIESARLVMLIIKIKPRFQNLAPPNMTAFKTSFILRGVTFLLPKPDPSSNSRVVPSRDARFDMLWRPNSPDAETSVRTTQLTIRPALVATIQEDKTSYEVTNQSLDIAFILARLPPEKSQVRLIITRLGRPFTESFELSDTPVPDPDSGGYLYREIKSILRNQFGNFVALEARLAVIDPKNGDVLGPDSALVFPQVPDKDGLEGSHSLFWCDGHLTVSWLPLKGFHVSITRRFTVMIRMEPNPEPSPLSFEVDDKAGSVRFDKEALGKYGSEKTDLVIKVVVTVQHAHIHGVLLDSYLYLRSMPTIDTNVLPVKSLLQHPEPPMSTSRFPSMRFWGQSGNIKTDLWYWRSNKRQLAGLQCDAGEGLISEQLGPEIASSNPDLTGIGALAVLQMHQDRRFKIVWIGNDGSVNLWSRENEDMEPHNWSDSVLAPPGSATTLGGGSLAVCGEVPIKEPRARRNPVIWWLGPRGEIFGRRAVPDSPTSEQWVDVEPGSSLPAGSIDISPSLARPAHMATVWTYDSNSTNHGEAAYLFWVHSNGDLMATCSYKPGSTDPKNSGTAIAYRSIGAAPGTALTAFIGHGAYTPWWKARAYVLWVAADGALCLGSRIEVLETIVNPNGWGPIVRISSPGTADPFSDLCLLGHTKAKAAAVVWASPKGKLQLAWAQSISIGANEWSEWGWKEMPVSLPAGQAPIIARAEAPDAIGRNEVYTPAGDGKWTGFAVDLSSIWKR